MALTPNNPYAISDNQQRVVDVQEGATGVYETLNATAASFLYLTTTAGTQVKTGPGIFHTLSILGSKSSSPITVYDGTSTSGTLIAQFGTGAQAVSFTFDAQFNTGLFVVVPSGDAVTITYL